MSYLNALFAARRPVRQRLAEETAELARLNSTQRQAEPRRSWVLLESIYIGLQTLQELDDEIAKERVPYRNRHGLKQLVPHVRHQP